MNPVEKSHSSGTNMSQYAMRSRIDVHVHYVPDFYRDALLEAGHHHPDGIGAIPQWSAEAALNTMERLGISTAILSISSPGVHFGNDEKARDLARRVNLEGRSLMQRHPTRFGYFASLPLPDIAGAIGEATYALDVLGADGIVLSSNHNGLYLGDPALEPLYSELNRRNAVIFVHPTSPHCACCARHNERYPRPMIEFIFETTRSISDLVLSGVLERYPNIRVLVPHAGAALPILTERIELLLPLLAHGENGNAPSMRAAMQKLHFDLAGAPVPQMLGALLQVAHPKRIHYGSDYPFTPFEVCANLIDKLEKTPLLGEDLRHDIWRDNAFSLFPRLNTAQNLHLTPATQTST